MGIKEKRKSSYIDLGYKDALGLVYRVAANGPTHPPGGGYYFSGWCRGVKEMLADASRRTDAERMIVQLYTYGPSIYIKQLVAKKVISNLSQSDITRMMKRWEKTESWKNNTVRATTPKSQPRTWMYVTALFFLALAIVLWQYSSEIKQFVM